MLVVLLFLRAKVIGMSFMLSALAALVDKHALLLLPLPSDRVVEAVQVEWHPQFKH
jgi:hypothetical protein